MKVKAKELGYYGNQRRREGEVFEIKNEKAFSEKWMEKCESVEEAPVEPAPQEAVEEEVESEDDESKTL